MTTHIAHFFSSIEDPRIDRKMNQKYAQNDQKQGRALKVTYLSTPPPVFDTFIQSFSTEIN
jgi:glucose-6-phosphate 1-dehydrogenase